jgi:NDP-sugar pyrophosphorylase family protein
MMSESVDNKEAPVIAILAGGLATRLRPLTQTVPKSMIQVAGEPFIAHQLRMLVHRGFREVFVLCGFMGQQIVDFVQDGKQFGCKVHYSFDGEIKLGTGGALRNALPCLGERFMVIYGDSYCRTDYMAIFSAFIASGKLGLMTIFQNNNLLDKSNVEFSDGRIVHYDKEHQTPEMLFIDYGINVFSAKAFATIEPGAAFDLSTLQVDLVRLNSLAGYEVYERFYEVGSHAGLAETNIFLSVTEHRY